MPEKIKSVAQKAFEGGESFSLAALGARLASALYRLTGGSCFRACILVKKAL